MNIAEWIALAVFIAIFVVMGILVTDNNGLKSQIKELQTQNTLYASANQQCDKDVKTANDAVAQLKADSERREKTAQEALQQAQAVAAHHEQIRTAIQAAPAPKKGDECVAAQQLVDQYLQRTRK